MFSQDDPRGYEGLGTRLGRVRFLLDHWDAIWGPFVSGAGGGGGSGLPPRLGRMASHPGVVELDRCLRVLEGWDVGAFRHVKAFRCGVEWRVVLRPVRVRTGRGRGFKVVPLPVREPIVPRWVDRGRVDVGERFLVGEFRGEVFVPDELWDAWRRPAVAA